MHNDAQLKPLARTAPSGRGSVVSYRYNSWDSGDMGLPLTVLGRAVRPPCAFPARRA
jgi:hypothetical protein